ncbi:MAG: FAD-dependent oxidoreductase, partial [Clostridia bacterium]|nr:FAD-dependent oxidoreductase [Clostridia bacterium]
MKKVNITLSLAQDESLILDKALKISKVRRRDVSSWRIAKKSVDARRKNDIKILYTIELFEGDEPEKPVYRRVNGKKVIVVGAGPAGLFAALNLVRHGVSVTVIERGERVEDRKKTVESFFSGGDLNENSNVQFGEGGAGTFSDGKLFTQVNSPEIKSVLEDFVCFGAPEDILYLNKPHIGSDNLTKVVKNMREAVIGMGGTFLFNEKVTALDVKNGQVKGVFTNKGQYCADKVVLSIGHSSRDTFTYLYNEGVDMESKEFAVGLRIEQLQEVINVDRYGDNYDNKKLPAADYKLVSHASDRAVFTFCMSPGGEVVPSASELGGLVVNGMSNYARSGKNANSAVICQVKKTDFGDKPMAGIDFQRSMERLAYAAAGDFIAPVQLAEHFVNDEITTGLKGVLPT